MKKQSSNSDKFFVGFGIVTALSGIMLIVMEQYVMGISGTIVGIGLTIQHVQKIRNQQDES